MADLPMLSVWDTEAKDLVVIRRGQAEALRESCRSGRLICPIKSCSEPALTTRRFYVNRWGTEVADGFRHLVKPDDSEHTEESIRHLDGKALVADWLKSLGLRHVRLERSVRIGNPQASGNARVRRPDVGAVTRAGERLAVEIQVSPISEDLWRQRTSDLATARYTVIWLWTWPINSDRTNASTTALRAQIEQGIRPWFFEPNHDSGPRLGATHQTANVDAERFQVPPIDPHLPLDITWRALAEHHLEGTRLAVGVGDVDDSAALAFARNRAKERSRRGPSGDGSVGHTITSPLPTDAALGRQEQRFQERQLRALSRGEIPESGTLPPKVGALCERIMTNDDRIWAPTVGWKSAVAWRLLNRPTGVSIAIRDVVDWVEQKYPCDKGAAVTPVRNFLRSLEGAGVLRLSHERAVILTSIAVPE